MQFLQGGFPGQQQQHPPPQQQPQQPLLGLPAVFGRGPQGSQPPQQQPLMTFGETMPMKVTQPFWPNMLIIACALCDEL